MGGGEQSRPWLLLACVSFTFLAVQWSILKEIRDTQVGLAGGLATTVQTAEYSIQLTEGPDGLAVQLKPMPGPIQLPLASSAVQMEEGNLRTVTVETDRIGLVTEAIPEHTAVEIRPGRADGRNLSREEMEKLISEPSPLWGFQKKEGILNPEEWMPEHIDTRRKNREQWREKLFNGTVDPMVQPPLVSSGCQVVVNHKYRFFWIKTRKTAGTSLKGGLGWICDNTFKDPPDADLSQCGYFPWTELEPEQGDAERWWESYFVFITVRNPYARFASAHSFAKHWGCPDRTLLDGCKDPFITSNGCAEDEDSQ